MSSFKQVIVLLFAIYVAPIAHLLLKSSRLRNKYVSFDPANGRMLFHNRTLFAEELRRSCTRVESRLQRDVFQLRKDFQNDGFLVLRDVLPPDVVDAVNLNRPKVVTNLFWYPFEKFLILSVDYFLGTDFQFSSIDSLWVDDPLLFSFWWDGCVAMLVGEVAMTATSTEDKRHLERMNPVTRLLVDFYIGFPQGIRPQVIGDWHTDTTSFDIVSEDSVGISAWMPLVDINPDVHGSSIYLASRAKYKEHAACKEEPIQPNEECIKHLNSIREHHSWKRGDLLLFSKDTFHRSQPSKQAGGLPERWSLVGRFISDDAKYNPPKGTFATHKKNTCKHGLKEGDAVVTPCFPILYPSKNNTEVKARYNGDLGHLSNFGMVLSQMKGLFTN